jgi:hypothetical protein
MDIQKQFVAWARNGEGEDDAEIAEAAEKREKEECGFQRNVDKRNLAKYAKWRGIFDGKGFLQEKTEGTEKKYFC